MGLGAMILVFLMLSLCVYVCVCVCVYYVKAGWKVQDTQDTIPLNLKIS